MSSIHPSIHFPDTFQQDMDEALDLAEISHELFQKKLAAIEVQSKIEKDPKKKNILRKKALALFSEYKNSLQVIEKYIQQIYENNKGK